MTFLDEINVSGEVIKFWKGFDLQVILDHPKDGKNGLMIVLIDSVESIKKETERDLLLDSILVGRKLEDFDNILKNLNGSYLMLYQSGGQDNILVSALKDKFIRAAEFQSRSVTN